MTDEAKQPNFSSELDRRKFIGVAAATAGAMLIRPALVRGTAANSAVRVGLLGCGGRGTEDASNLVDTGNARCANSPRQKSLRFCQTMWHPSRADALRIHTGESQ